MRVGVWGRTYSHRLSRVLTSGTSGKPRRKPLHCMGCIGAVVLYGTGGAAGTSLELYGAAGTHAVDRIRDMLTLCTVSNDGLWYSVVSSTAQVRGRSTAHATAAAARLRLRSRWEGGTVRPLQGAHDLSAEPVGS